MDHGMSVGLTEREQSRGSSRDPKRRSGRITSYAVGQQSPDPDSSWLQGESLMEGTHLSRRLVRPWLGTVTLHPARTPQRPSVRQPPLLCLECRILRNQAQRQEAPQRDHQPASQRDDGDPSDAPALLSDTIVEPAAERTLGLVLQPKPRQLDCHVAYPPIASLADPLVMFDPATAPRAGRQPGIGPDLAPVDKVLPE